ncbi:hypothetical protein L1987_09451 [Smallanthus sonchifolius]|uniref:Uncharacterized protein n=1 Tax=Smallanthus sonchifolius TaxID=185202 RepID=A0ACB9JPJ8_9ASTR|nr:hypothetical protein L1987_09451 [Smallanthus sonchifolius]
MPRLRLGKLGNIPLFESNGGKEKDAKKVGKGKEKESQDPELSHAIFKDSEAEKTNQEAKQKGDGILRTAAVIEEMKAHAEKETKAKALVEVEVEVEVEVAEMKEAMNVIALAKQELEVSDLKKRLLKERLHFR